MLKIKQFVQLEQHIYGQQVQVNGNLLVFSLVHTFSIFGKNSDRLHLNDIGRIIIPLLRLRGGYTG